MKHIKFKNTMQEQIVKTLSSILDDQFKNITKFSTEIGEPVILDSKTCVEIAHTLLSLSLVLDDVEFKKFDS